MSQPANKKPALQPTPASGRHTILPGVGLAEPNVVAQLYQSPSVSEELPDLDIPGRLPEERPRLVRRDAHLSDDTEKLLNEMIGECGFLMREVAFRCIIQSCGVEDRLAFMRSAVSFAETGATVAKAVARLRHAPVNQDAMISKALANAEHRKKAESAKQ